MKFGNTFFLCTYFNLVCGSSGLQTRRATPNIELQRQNLSYPRKSAAAKFAISRGGSLERATALSSSLSPLDRPQEIDASQTSNMKGVLFMAASSLSFSLMFLGVKLYSSAPTFTLVFYRSIFQAIISGILLQAEGEHPAGPAEVRGLLTLRAATGSIAVAAFYFAVQHLPLPDAITLQFTTPVFAAIMAMPMLGETWKLKDMVGAVFCLSGVLMIARPSWLFGSSLVMTAGTSSTAASTAVGLTGALFAAIAYVLVRRIGSRADANVMVFYYAAFSALSAPLGQHLLEGGSWDVIGNPSSKELLVFAGLGLAGFLGQLFTNIGLTQCDSAATATLVTNTQIVFAFLFEIFILHESLSPWSIAGTALIVGYMALTGIDMLGKEKTE